MSTQLTPLDLVKRLHGKVKDLLEKYEAKEATKEYQDDCSVGCTPACCPFAPGDKVTSRLFDGVGTVDSVDPVSNGGHVFAKVAVPNGDSLPIWYYLPASELSLYDPPKAQVPLKPNGLVIGYGDIKQLAERAQQFALYFLGRRVVTVDGAESHRGPVVDVGLSLVMDPNPVEGMKAGDVAGGATITLGVLIDGTDRVIYSLPSKTVLETELDAV